MKKYNLNLKENEELIVDCDDLMETELAKFKETIKDLTEEEIKLFANWIKIYKLLNYDIIEGLTVNKVFRFNDCSAVVELTFRGNIEYDLLNLNPETMTVACMNVKNDAVRPYVVRRLLIPDTVEEALSFAKSMLPNEGIDSISKTINDIKNHGDKYNVTEQINLYDPTFERIEREEPQQETATEQTNTTTEEPKPEPEKATAKETKPKENKPKFFGCVPYQEEPLRRHIRSVLNNKNGDGSINMRGYLSDITGRRA